MPQNVPPEPGTEPLGWADLWPVKEMDKRPERPPPLAGHAVCREDKINSGRGSSASGFGEVTQNFNRVVGPGDL